VVVTINKKKIKEIAKIAIASTTDHKTLAYKEIIKRMEAELVIARLLCGDMDAIDDAKKLIGMKE